MIVVEKAKVCGYNGETGGNDSFQDLGDSLEEKDDAEQ